jgi:hypothetical protein
MISADQRAVAHAQLDRLLDEAADSFVRQLIVMGTEAPEGEVIAYSVVAPGFGGTGEVYRTRIKDFEAGLQAVAGFWEDAGAEAGP